MALVRASAPPVIVSAAGTVLLTVSVRSMSFTQSGGRLLLYIFLALLGWLMSFLGFLAQLIVMGGASRNLVMHMLLDKPVTARLIYRNVRSRFWKLLLATLAVVLCLIIAAVLATVPATVALILMLIVVGILAAFGLPWLTAIVGIIMYVAIILLWLYVFFLIAGRVAYVPQVLMVEGKGVLDAISRSAELARGNVRRLMGMFLFTGFAGYSAVMLLLVPLGWFAYLNGVNPFEMDATRVPAWYTISSEVLGQVATILLAPVWMMGLSLLYVDERVRHEGYDIELLAAQVFGEMPAVPEGYRAPLAPAIAAPQAKQAHAAVEGKTAHAEEKPATVEKPPGSVLGL